MRRSDIDVMANQSATSSFRRRSDISSSQDANNVSLSVRGVSVAFGDFKVLEGLDLDVHRGEILGFVGGSGQGKSVLMRTILGLNQKQAGRIRTDLPCPEPPTKPNISPR